MENTKKTIRLDDMENRWIYLFIFRYWGIVQSVIYVMIVTALGFFFLGLFCAIMLQIFAMFQLQIGTIAFLLLLGLICGIGGFTAKSLIERD